MSHATVDASPGELNIEWTRGDTVPIPLTFTDENGDPVDLSGFEFAAQVRHKPNIAEHWSFEINVDDAATGVLLVHPPTDPKVPGRGVWDLKRHVAGEQVSTLLTGRVTVFDSITAFTS